MSTPPEPAGTDDVAQLRRRLYQPSASDDDVDRYRSAAAAIAPPPPAAPVGRPRRRRWTLAALIAAPVAVVAGILGVDAARPTPASTAGSVPTVALAEQRATPAPYSFQQVDGSSEPLSLTRTVTDAGVSFAGIGPGTIPLDPSTLSDHGGVIRVEMLTTTPVTVGWRMQRLATRGDFSSDDETLGRGRARQEMAPVAPAQVAYDGAPPTTIRVEAPAGTRWWLDLGLAQRAG